MLNCGIYEIVNRTNGHRYIGSSGNLRSRWSTHRSFLRRNAHTTPHLQAAWNKYGETEFEFKPLIYCDADMLKWWEDRFLQQMSPEYNHAKASRGPVGVTRTDEYKRKMSEAKRGRPWNASQEVQEANRLRMIGNHFADGNQNHLGHTHSEEAREKIREHRATQVFTDEMRAKQGRSMQQAYLDGRCNRSKLNLNLANVIRERVGSGEKQRALAQEYGVSRDTISRIVNNKTFVEVAHA